MRKLLMLAALLAATSTATKAHAQAVQLPTFRYFTVQTTVSVPDRGGVVLGGVDRASSGSTSRGFGPLRNRASGSSIGSSTASVHATIIDHQELDQQVLAEAARRRGEYVTRTDLGERDAAASRLSSAAATKAEQLSRNVAVRVTEQPPPIAPEQVDSLADIRARAAAREQAKLDEATARLASGIAAEEAGKLASARGYYEAAIRYGNDDIRAQAVERLSKIALPPARSQRVVNH